MGGRKSRPAPQVVVQQVRPPEIVQQVQDMQQRLAQMQKPANMAQQSQNLKEQYWEELGKKNFQLLPKSVILIGKTSVGKSSLINTLFKTNLPTSKASCTKDVTMVSKMGNVSVYDCPGFDEHFDIEKNPEKIPHYLGQMEHIYYLYDGLIEEDVVKTLKAMKKKFYAVRTKCDPDDNPGENASIRAGDVKRFKELGCEMTVFLTSKKGGEDNSKLLQHILAR